jgi:hypothetical protein
MAPLENSHHEAQGETAHTGAIILFALLVAALLAGVSLIAGTENGNSWALAAEMVSRFSLLIFIAAMTVEPAARLLPRRLTIAAAGERSSLVLAFVAVLAISLLCLVVPSWLGGQSISVRSTAYCILTAIILTVMLFSAHPGTRRKMGGPAWRALQRIAIAYFWLAFTIAGIGQIASPHRPDYWHGFSLALLVAALLIRFADSFLAHRRLADKVG